MGAKGPLQFQRRRGSEDGTGVRQGTFRERSRQRRGVPAAGMDQPVDGVEHLAAELGRKYKRVPQRKITHHPLGSDLPNLKLRVRSQSFQLISLRKVGQLPLLSSALRWRISAESGAKGLVVPLQGEPEVPDGQVGAKQLAIEGTISVLCYGEFLGEEGKGALPPHPLLQGEAPKWVAEASVTTDRGARGFG